MKRGFRRIRIRDELDGCLNYELLLFSESYYCLSSP